MKTSSSMVCFQAGKLPGKLMRLASKLEDRLQAMAAQEDAIENSNSDVPKKINQVFSYFFSRNINCFIAAFTAIKLFTIEAIILFISK